MIRLRTILQSVRCAALVAVCWLSYHAGSFALAAADTEKEVPGAKGSKWVIPYALVIFGIGLGLLVVLHASRRRDRARPQTYEGSGPGATSDE